MKMKRSFFKAGMIVFYLMVIPFFVYSPGIYAQEKKRTCAAMEVHERLMRTVPAYRENQTAIENLTRNYLLRGVLRTEVVKIPVVVHVVYNTPEQNISDEQIKGQIRILNEDYRKLNADVSSVPSVFQSLIADTRIEFALACRAPDGGSTNGVIRKSTTATEFGSDDTVKFSGSGGSDAWPRDRYLNIWVCNLADGLLGYAQFPGGPADTDGVVITYTAFGDTGTAAPPFDKGRTATHEIGHWLNLRHIWGDDCPGGDQCGGSDLVDDTPNQECMNYGCPTFPNVSCNNDPNGDIFMDYMDYTDDACMVMFTNGQSARMDAAITGPRSAIMSSDGLKCPPSGGNCGQGSITAMACILTLYGIGKMRKKSIKTK